VAANGNKRGASRGPNRPASDAPRVVYVPRPDATAEREIAALAATYRFVLERHEGKQGTDVAELSTGRPEGSPEECPVESEGGQHA